VEFVTSKRITVVKTQVRSSYIFRALFGYFVHQRWVYRVDLRDAIIECARFIIFASTLHTEIGKTTVNAKEYFNGYIFYYLSIQGRHLWRQGGRHLPPHWFWKIVIFLFFAHNILLFSYFAPPLASRSKLCPPPKKTWNDDMCLSLY